MTTDDENTFKTKSQFIQKNIAKMKWHYAVKMCPASDNFCCYNFLRSLFWRVIFISILPSAVKLSKLRLAWTERNHCFSNNMIVFVVDYVEIPMSLIVLKGTK